MKEYKLPANYKDSSLVDPAKSVGQLTLLVGLHTDTPVPIALLKGFCSHTTIREKYVPLGLKLYNVDQKTCVRLSEFLKVREARAESRETAGN